MDKNKEHIVAAIKRIKKSENKKKLFEKQWTSKISSITDHEPAKFELENTSILKKERKINNILNNNSSRRKLSQTILDKNIDPKDINKIKDIAYNEMSSVDGQLNNSDDLSINVSSIKHTPLKVSKIEEGAKLHNKKPKKKQILIKKKINTKKKTKVKPALPKFKVIVKIEQSSPRMSKVYEAYKDNIQDNISKKLLGPRKKKPKADLNTAFIGGKNTILN